MSITDIFDFVDDPLYRRLSHINLAIVEAREANERCRAYLLHPNCPDDVVESYEIISTALRSLLVQRQALLDLLNARRPSSSAVLRLHAYYERQSERRKAS